MAAGGRRLAWPDRERFDHRATLADLKERLSRLSDLGRIGRVLGWDQQVMMPPGGAAARAEQIGTLGRILHEALIDDEVGRLLEQLR